MASRDRHLSDEELLLVGEDGALAPRRLAGARDHLARCRDCACRRAELAATLQEVTRACREAAEPMRPFPATRERLQAALAADECEGTRGAPAWARPTPVAALWATAAALLALLAAWAGAIRMLPSTPTGPEQSAPGVGLPRPDLTPGSVRPIAAGDLCGQGTSMSGTVPVDPAVPRQVFDAYGVDYSRADAYELDFLVTPELGGAAEARNLWPQPYRSTTWNAYVKDELERHLLRLVCGGILDLATAQLELSTDWVAAYKRYLLTNRPT